MSEEHTDLQSFLDFAVDENGKCYCSEEFTGLTDKILLASYVRNWLRQAETEIAREQGFNSS